MAGEWRPDYLRDARLLIERMRAEDDVFILRALIRAVELIITDLNRRDREKEIINKPVKQVDPRQSWQLKWVQVYEGEKKVYESEKKHYGAFFGPNITGYHIMFDANCTYEMAKQHVDFLNSFPPPLDAEQVHDHRWVYPAHVRRFCEVCLVTEEGDHRIGNS